MYMIRKLTFDVSDMKTAARNALKSCMQYLDAYRSGACIADLVQAAQSFGKAVVWLDNLSDIGIEYASENESISAMLDTAETFGLKW